MDVLAEEGIIVDWEGKHDGVTGGVARGQGDSERVGGQLCLISGIEGKGGKSQDTRRGRESECPSVEVPSVSSVHCHEVILS